VPTTKLTDAAVQRLKAPAGARVDYFDGAFPGLALRVTGTVDQRPVRRTWTLFYRFDGKQRRLTMGSYPALSLADARQAATQAQLQIRAGEDPVKATAKERRPPDTLVNVAAQFVRVALEGRNRAPRTIEEVQRNLQNHVLSRWADRDIASITRRDVIELLDVVMAKGSVVRGADGSRTSPGGRVAANRVLAAIRALFNFALDRGIIESTPAARVRRPGEETPRDRTLTANEITAIWGNAETLGYPLGRFFQLALITGQRRDEVAHMQWADLDLDARLWVLPAATTKARRSHVVPLAPLAVELLKAIPHKRFVTDGVTNISKWVLTTSGQVAIAGFNKAKPRLDRAITQSRDGIPLAGWTIHDMRRTVATEMARLGVSRFTIGRVLNHADRSVTGIYDRHLYVAEKRQALEYWSSYLASLTQPSGDEVMVTRTATHG
jgi:integrase